MVLIYFGLEMCPFGTKTGKFVGAKEVIHRQ